MTASPLMELRARAEADLKARFPGVLSVGFGLKESDGKVTDRSALRIYVREKKPSSELSVDQLLPSQYEGVRTDVVVPQVFEPAHCEDRTTHSPLIGGITITPHKVNSLGQSQQLARGTLGFFATLDGKDGPDNVVLVSCNHVLTEGGAAKGDRVSNPLSREAPNPGDPLAPQTELRELPEMPNYIGNIDNEGIKGHHEFNREGTGKLPYFLDCATAKLDIRISTTCNRSTGVEYANRIRDLKLNPTPENPDGDSQIIDVDWVLPEQIAQGEGSTDTNPANDVVVFKVGRRTSKTRGKVVDAYGTGTSGTVQQNGIIIIEVIGTDCDGFERFAAVGDSGSAIITADHKLIGILFGVGDKRAAACHIHPALDFLGITAITDAHPPVGPAGVARSGQIGALFPRDEQIAVLLDRFETHPLTRTVYCGFMAHWPEIVRLVNTNRKLLVAWHRVKGPAYVAHLSESARQPDHAIPREIGGVDRTALLVQMARLLKQTGSPEIRRFIEDNLSLTLEIVEEIDTLHGFAAQLSGASEDA